MAMGIKSEAFAAGQTIPAKYTCEGKDVSPPLTFSNIPKGTKSLALIVDDPDAPMGTFDHWVGWNIPPATLHLEEGQGLPVEGSNHYGQRHYRGPCPPRGNKPHHYHFIVYALDTTLTLAAGSSKEQLKKAMEGHILDQADLIGLYVRP